jgi:hypothetical protein
VQVLFLNFSANLALVWAPVVKLNFKQGQRIDLIINIYVKCIVLRLFIYKRWGAGGEYLHQNSLCRSWKEPNPSLDVKCLDVMYTSPNPPQPFFWKNTSSIWRACRCCLLPWGRVWPGPQRQAFKMCMLLSEYLASISSYSDFNST